MTQVEVAARAGRWTVLAIGTCSQAATSASIYGVPLLVPAMRRELGLSLEGAGAVVSAPIVGMLLTLIAWGALADRYGERLVIATGVSASAVLLAAASQADSAPLLAVLLGLAGAAGASVNAASGRMIMGWFSVKERGLAMGIRQTAQPLGVGIAGLMLPPLASAHGLSGAILGLAGFSAVVSVLVVFGTSDPPRPMRTDSATAGSPYRSAVLWRIHAASAMLVFPQFAVSTFTLVYLVGVRGWDSSTAGRLIFGFQFVGATARIAAGLWSDRRGSRLRPMRQLAVASALLMVGLGIGAWTHAAWIVVVFGLAALVTVADNGLAYVSVAEIAGPSWAGRALGVQNTGQNIASALTAPVLAAIIGSGSGHYGLAFTLVAIPPLLAIALTPVPAERVDDR
ncbi:MAG: MFS transporter [Actinobacteria bacterium]|nr:MFS transporter [Actinomycetota bacterium]